MSGITSAATGGSVGLKGCENFFAIMARAARGEQLNASAFVIGYHFMPEDLKQEILASNLLTAEQKDMLSKLMKIHYQVFLPTSLLGKILSRFSEPQIISWKSYSDRIGVAPTRFWLVMTGVSDAIRTYVLSQDKWHKLLKQEM